MRAFLAALLLSGCGVGTPLAWRSPMGVYVAKGELENYFAPDVVDLYAGHAVEGLAALGYPRASLDHAVQGSVVEVHGAPIPCAQGTCAGVEVWSSLAVAVAPCIHNTALQHEMLHWFLQASVNDPDTDHAKADVWALDIPLGTCP